METSLPDLPFVNYGKAELNPAGHHSAVQTSPRAYPRTDLETFTPWTSFLGNVDQAIRYAVDVANLPDTPFAIPQKMNKFVVNEEGIRSHAESALHDPVQVVVNKLGVMGYFEHSNGGNPGIIGSPDFVWITSPTKVHAKLVVEYKTWWAADMVDLPAARRRCFHNTLSRQSLHALEQEYGYMTLNNNRFGILTNWKRTWFLRRAETSQRKTLEYYLVELNGTNPPISMLKAWVGMVLLANNDWFYASPTLSTPPPALHFGLTSTVLKETKKALAKVEQYEAVPVKGEYPCLPLDIRLCIFDRSTRRVATVSGGCVVPAQFLGPSDRKFSVVCKVVDIMRYPEAGVFLRNEARAYAALKGLQGREIPKFHGFYEIWGILRLLALEPVGNAIPEDENIDQGLRVKMRATLRHIHEVGYIHGDIARQNFCRTKEGEVVLVDLETCRRAQNLAELDGEMCQVDGL